MRGTLSGVLLTGRRELPFLVALALGIALRVVALLAYRPALLFPDSFNYLHHADDMRLSPVHPAGYSAFLWPFVVLLHSVQAIAAAQHVLGLAIAVAGYALLVRRGLPRWGATLATLPVLLDPLQLILEEYVLSDVLFEALLVAACLVLLWPHRPGVPALVGVGLLVAAATLTRGAGTVVLGAFVVAALFLRASWPRLLALLLAVLVPLAGYAVAYHRVHGPYTLESTGPRFLYARLAPIVVCDGVSLPVTEQPLCPRKSLRDRASIDWYMWHGRHAAQYHVKPPPGMTQVQMVRDFDRRVVRAEPRRYAHSVAVQLLKSFSGTRHAHIKGRPSGRWLFHPDYWLLPMLVAHHRVQPGTTAVTSVVPAAASFLTGYRHWLWTPGPLLGLLLLVSLAAVLGLGRSRRSGDRVAVGLLAATCMVPVLTAIAVNGFSWRYQLPEIPLLPMAGALATAALVRGAAPGRRPDPLPRIRLAVVLLVAVALGGAAGAAAAWSGWASTRTAVVGGAVAAVVVAVVLLVSSERSGRNAVLSTPPGSGDSPPPR